MQSLPSASYSTRGPHTVPPTRAHLNSRQTAQPPLALPQVSLVQTSCLRSTGSIARAAPAQAADVAEAEASTSQPGSNGAQTAASDSPLDAVPLESGVGADYTALKAHLAAGQFQKADDETRAKLIQIAGKDAVKRNWVYFSEVQFIPAEDLRTLDALWRAASDGKFGYAAQKEVWQQNRKYWTKFFKAISWVIGDRNNYRKWPQEFIYSLDAPKGHLPLTNALRGTQLFEAILMHPAFVKEEQRPDWLK